MWQEFSEVPLPMPYALIRWSRACEAKLSKAASTASSWFRVVPYSLCGVCSGSTSTSNASLAVPHPSRLSAISFKPIKEGTEA